MSYRARTSGLWWAFVAGLIVVDAVAVLLALGLAKSTYSPDAAVGSGQTVLVVIFWLLLFGGRGLYKRKYLLGGPMEYARITGACIAGVVCLLAVGSLVELQPRFLPASLVVFGAISIMLVCLGRFTMRRVAYYLRRYGHFVTRVLIAGVDSRSRAVAAQLQAPLSGGTEVVGFLDDSLPEGAIVDPALDGGMAGPLRVLGTPLAARAVAERVEADLLILNPQALAWESAQHLILQAVAHGHSIETLLIPLPYDMLAGGVETASLHYVPLLRLQERRIQGVDALLKSSFDVLLAFVLLAVALPAVVIAMLRARWRGVSPLLERRSIMGENGNPVSLVLLNHKVTKHLLLRGWPALWGVLLRRLSIVGPQPRRVEDLAGPLASYSVVQAMKPGLTGPWRLIPGEAELNGHQQVSQDIWYVRNYTIWQDLFICWQTFRALVPLGPAPSVHLGRWDLVGAAREPERGVTAGAQD